MTTKVGNNTGKDVCLTSTDAALYAICLGWPGDELTIERPAAFLYPGEVFGVTMLGSDEKLSFEQTRRSLTIRSPREKVGEHAFVFKIARKSPYA